MDIGGAGVGTCLQTDKIDGVSSSDTNECAGISTSASTSFLVSHKLTYSLHNKSLVPQPKMCLTSLGMDGISALLPVDCVVRAF